MNKLLFALIVLFACRNNGSPPVLKQKTAATHINQRDSVRRLASGSVFMLTGKWDSLEQRMKVVELSKDSMDFSLITINTITMASDTLEGAMTYVESGGDESDAGDDGGGFFYAHWNYTGNNGCQLDFRVDVDGVRYVRISDFGCSALLNTHNPIETRGVLKRVERN